MQVILLERIGKLGAMGEIVTVKPGHARNYLIPQGKALRATDQALADFNAKRAQLEAHNLELKSEAESMAADVDGKSVVIIRQASESAHLYGSVSNRDVAAAFTEAGITLDKGQVRLGAALKTLGLHTVPVALHPEVEVEVQVNIARSEEEAEIQAGLREANVEDQDADLEEDNADDRVLFGGEDFTE